MMYLTASGVLGSLVGAQPSAASDGQPGPWVTSVYVRRSGFAHADNAAPGDGPNFGAASDPGWSHWITPNDMPADLRTRPVDVRSRLLVQVDASGRATGCRAEEPSAEARLDALACRLLLERGHFTAPYVGPLTRGAALWLMSVTWRTEARAEYEEDLRRASGTYSVAPPKYPPPSYSFGWPRLEWTDAIELRALPAVQASYPHGAGTVANAVVSLDLTFEPRFGRTSCTIGVSSGDDALDAASCTVARGVQLRYVHPCDPCEASVVPLQIVWNPRGGSHLRFPLPRYSRTPPPQLRDPADNRAGLSYRSTTRSLRLDPQTLPRPAVFDGYWTGANVFLTVERDGRVTSCRLGYGTNTGIEAIDEQLCDLARREADLSPATDVFGDVVATRINVSVSVRGSRVDPRHP